MTLDATLAYAGRLAQSAGILLLLMAVIAVVETLLPLFRRPKGGSRRTANLALTLITLAINIALSTAVLGIALAIERNGWGVLAPLNLPLAMQIVVGVIALDAMGYLLHLTMHKFSPLWRVHRVHHSDVHVDITTAFRQHPIESIWRFSLTTGLAFLLGLPPAAIAIYRLVSALNALFEHMNVPLCAPLDRLVSVLFVTPNMHKMHHSRKMAETDSNYGNVFSVFDRMFRTFTQPRLPGLDYGLIGFDGGDSVGKLLAMPFKDNK